LGRRNAGLGRITRRTEGTAMEEHERAHGCRPENTGAGPVCKSPGGIQKQPTNALPGVEKAMDLGGFGHRISRILLQDWL